MIVSSYICNKSRAKIYQFWPSDKQHFCIFCIWDLFGVKIIEFYLHKTIVERKFPFVLGPCRIYSWTCLGHCKSKKQCIKLLFLPKVSQNLSPSLSLAWDLVRLDPATHQQLSQPSMQIFAQSQYVFLIKRQIKIILI